ncbi:MAG: GDP-mannose 4,6-dehydratase [Thermodesulfobacteriota bacterium]
MFEWTDKKVLVTGAGGFIGSHLAERLAERCARVRAMVHYHALGARGWLDRSPWAEKMEVVAGDVRDREMVEEIVSGIEVVFHLAALIAIPYSYRAPMSYVGTNVEGTLNLLNAARRSGVKLVVHTSTSEVYGTARYVPIDEQHPLQAQSPYAATKIAADKLTESFFLSYGLPATVVRPFNTYGPRQTARAVIPAIISQALTSGEVRLGNLDPTRDFNYVADTVEGFIKAAECPQAIGQVINLGTGREVSVRQLVGMVQELLKKDLAVITEEARARPEGSEVERLLASNRKAVQMIGWSPEYSLEQGLRLTIDWMKDHLDYYRADHYAV